MEAPEDDDCCEGAGQEHGTGAATYYAGAAYSTS